MLDLIDLNTSFYLEEHQILIINLAWKYYSSRSFCSYMSSHSSLDYRHGDTIDSFIHQLFCNWVDYVVCRSSLIVLVLSSRLFFLNVFYINENFVINNLTEPLYLQVCRNRISNWHGHYCRGSEILSPQGTYCYIFF